MARDLQRRRLFLAELRNHRIRARKLALHVDWRAAAVEGGAVQGAHVRMLAIVLLERLQALALAAEDAPKANAAVDGSLARSFLIFSGSAFITCSRPQMLLCSRWQSSVRSSLSSK